MNEPVTTRHPGKRSVAGLLVIATIISTLFRQASERARAPALVDAYREQPIEQVVRRRNAVEHRPPQCRGVMTNRSSRRIIERDPAKGEYSPPLTPPNYSPNRKYIAVAGNIGAGKSTLTHMLSGALNWQPFFEANAENPYLADFYADMTRWSFHSQVFYLGRRLEHHRLLVDHQGCAVQDRTVYEDAEIFARNLFESGMMTERDYDAYRHLYVAVSSFLPPPDLIVYLEANVDTLVRHIAKRYMREFQEIQVGDRNTTAAAIQHQYCVVHARDRYAADSRAGAAPKTSASRQPEHDHVSATNSRSVELRGRVPRRACCVQNGRFRVDGRIRAAACSAFESMRGVDRRLRPQRTLHCVDVEIGAVGDRGLDQAGNALPLHLQVILPLPFRTEQFHHRENEKTVDHHLHDPRETLPHIRAGFGIPSAGTKGALELVLEFGVAHDL